MYAALKLHYHGPTEMGDLMYPQPQKLKKNLKNITFNHEPFEGIYFDEIQVTIGRNFNYSVDK